MIFSDKKTNSLPSGIASVFLWYIVQTSTSSDSTFLNTCKEYLSLDVFVSNARISSSNSGYFAAKSNLFLYVLISNQSWLLSSLFTSKTTSKGDTFVNFKSPSCIFSPVSSSLSITLPAVASHSTLT